jgi:hypothetical protein
MRQHYGKYLVLLLSVLATISFTACGSSGSDGESPTGETLVGETPTQKSANKLELLDASGNKLPEDSTVDISAVSSTSASMSKKSISLAPATITDGLISLEGLSEGIYKLTITVKGKVIVTFLEIPAENFQEVVSAMAPVVIEDAEVTVINDAIIASISGTVYNKSGEVIEGAQVSVSGGAKTNGAVATAFTDENGVYKLVVNTSKDNLVALLNATITVSADGYNKQSKTYKVSNLSNESGVNFSMSAESSAESTLIYSEDFEGETANWTVNQLAGDNVHNTWNIHTSQLNISNKSYVNNLVKLAPNDSTNGLLPDPVNGSSCFWYGNPDNSDGSTGSFIDAVSELDYNLSGGNSLSSYNSGELISPSIDLTEVSGFVNVTFKTWWEIESVNPNANGFDLMMISVSTDDGVTWRDLAKLNPLSDPQSADIDRDPIPFSNTGFNSAPVWQEQEGISLVDADGETLAGQTIKLKYTFNTVDGLFNGFRGWMIDDIKIRSGEGTFPLLSNGNFDIYADMPEYSFFVSSVSPSSYDTFTGDFVSLTSGESETFQVGLDYYSSSDVTFKLQLKDSMTNEVLVDNIATQTADAKPYEYTTEELYEVAYDEPILAAPSLNTNKRAVTKKAVAPSTSVTLSGSATVPAAASGSISLWVVMISSGSVAMEYPVEFYEVD